MSTKEMERQIEENLRVILWYCDEMRRKGLLPPKDEKVDERLDEEDD